MCLDIYVIKYKIFVLSYYEDFCSGFHEILLLWVAREVFFCEVVWKVRDKYQCENQDLAKVEVQLDVVK